MQIYLSKEDYLESLVKQLSKIWIVRKHPQLPYRMPGHLAAFTIHKIYFTKKEAEKEAEIRNKRSSFLFTVQRIDLSKI